MLQTVLDILVIAFLIFGLFFMVVAAVGLVRLPDTYHRMHAATKGATLGIIGMVIAAGLALGLDQEGSAFDIIAKIALIILFQFVANPVGAHMLAKAAHLDRSPLWSGTLDDELEQDAG